MASLISTARGAQTTMSARFSPERLGAPTAVSLGFQITGTQVPAPLSGVQVNYPSDLGLATSGLGQAACAPDELELGGPTACPPDSRMGYGSALVEIPIGPALIKESVQLALFAGPSPDGYLHLLIAASGGEPVKALLVLPAILLAGHLSVMVPPIPSLPEAPYVALVQMRLTLGGSLTYYETVHGRSIAYHPPGVGLPSSCPRGGFPFDATLTFINATSTTMRAAVPCPHRR